ncbi:MAG: sulfatase [Candidatus Hydrogenedentota bacterium]
MANRPESRAEGGEAGAVQKLGALAVWSLALPGPWVYREVVGGQAAPFWCGTQSETWLVVGIAAAGAALFIFLAGGILQWTAGRFAKIALPSPAAAFGGMVFLWAVLMLILEIDPVLISVPTVLYPTALFLAALLLRAMCRMPYGTSGFVAVTALASGIAAHEMIARAFLLTEMRARAAFDYSLMWMAFVGLAGVLLMAVPRTGYRAYRGVVLAVLACVLPVWLGVMPHLINPPDTRMESLVMITMDALRADHCSVYGSANPTPNIDAVAEKGVVFERAYVTAPWTLPSVYSMFASDYSPLWLEDQNGGEWAASIETAFFDLHEPTIAELFQEKGYKTAAFIGNSLLGDTKRLLRGMDTVKVLPNRGAETHNPCEGMPLLGPALVRLRPGLERKWPLDSTRRLTAYARRFLQSARGEPVFLWIHYMDPHGPYNPPDVYRDVVTKYAFYPSQPGVGCEWSPALKNPAWVESEKPQFIPQEKLYSGEVRYVDEMLGTVLDLIPKESWVVLGADHGEEFLDHGRMAHGITFYEETIHVPLIIAGPDCVPGRVSTPVSYVDLMPTLAELKGIEPPSYWTGKSFAGFVAGQNAENLDRECYAGSNNRTVLPPSAMVLQNEWKLILDIRGDEVELYNLEDDPKEQENLADEGLPPEAEILKSKAAQWAQNVTQKHRTDRESAPAEVPPESKDWRKEFEALGYL